MKSKYISKKIGRHKFGLGDIEVYERMSEETTALTADVYIDDYKVGSVSNSGKGEGNYPHIYAMVDRYIAICEEIKNHRWTFDGSERKSVENEYDMDYLIADMVHQAWYGKKHIYYFRDERTDGGRCGRGTAEKAKENTLN